MGRRRNLMKIPTRPALTARPTAHYNSAMFSLPKLAVLALIIAGIWYGFKLVGRLDKARKEADRNERRSVRDKSAKVPEDTGDTGDTEDMVSCPSCGTYVIPAEIVGGHCDRCRAAG